MDERPATDKNDICHHKKKTSWDMLEKVNAETKWIKRKQNHLHSRKLFWNTSVIETLHIWIEFLTMLKRFEKKYRIVASRRKCYYSGNPFWGDVTNQDMLLNKTC